MAQLYDQYDNTPQTFRFYVPQLVNFLVHGRAERPLPFDVFILDKCEKCVPPPLLTSALLARLLTPADSSRACARSLQFAHQVWWFLNAFCPNARCMSTVAAAVARGKLQEASLRSAIEWQGGVAAQNSQQSGTLRLPHNYDYVRSDGGGAGRRTSSVDTSDLSVNSTQRLLGGRSTSGPTPHSVRSESADAGAARPSTAPPLLNTSAGPGVRNKFGVDVTAVSPRNGREELKGSAHGRGRARAPFRECIDFMERLTELADSLTPVCVCLCVCVGVCVCVWLFDMKVSTLIDTSVALASGTSH